VPECLRLAVPNQRLVDRLEEPDQVFQAIGDRAQRQIQAVRGPVGQESIGRPIEQILVQEQGHPDRHPEDGLGDDPGRRRCGDDTGMGGTGTGGPIAAAADDSAMGADVDLQEDRILGAREVVEGLAAPRATALIGAESVVLDDGREMGIVTPFGTGFAGLLTSGPTRWRVGGGGERGRRLGGGGLGLSTEELLFAEA
jgi:hypothetical protein